MKQLLCVFLLSALALAAGDVSGNWSGMWDIGPDGQPGPHHMVLKQEGVKVTGTAGPSEDRQFPISNGMSEGEKLTFELNLGNGEMMMRFYFTVDGDRAVGVAKVDRDGKTRTLKLTAKRVK